MGGFYMRSVSRAERLSAPTVETYCWLYAAGCIDGREQEVLRSGEHGISHEDFEELRRHLEQETLPPDDLVRRVFRRPFETLGEDCTLADMQYYWRVTHRNLSEKTPVFKVQIAPYTKSMQPREDRHGRWWDTYVFNPMAGEAGAFMYLRLHNVHGYTLTPGTWVFAHVGVIGSDAMAGIIAEEVPGDDPVYGAFAT